MTAVVTATHTVYAKVVAAGTGCPQAPPGLQKFADEIQGWIKWVVLALLAAGFVISIGMLVWGRVTHHPRGARIGFDGLIIVLVAAVLLVAGWGIVTAIVGNGC